MPLPKKHRDKIKVVPLPPKIRDTKLDIVPAHLRTQTMRKNRVKMIASQTGPQIIENGKAQIRADRKDVHNWTVGLDKAAYYVAEDRLSLAQVYEKTGVAPNKIKTYLMTNGEFAERVKMYQEKWYKKIESTGMAQRAVRVNVYQELIDKTRDIVRQRAEKYKNKTQPGVNTGLMVRTVKAVGHGHKTKIVRGWDFDKDLTKDLKDTMMQLAKELGQWSEKSENLNMTLIREYAGVSTDQV